VDVLNNHRPAMMMVGGVMIGDRDAAHPTKNSIAPMEKTQRLGRKQRVSLAIELSDRPVDDMATEMAALGRSSLTSKGVAYVRTPQEGTIPTFHGQASPSSVWRPAFRLAETGRTRGLGGWVRRHWRGGMSGPP